MKRVMTALGLVIGLGFLTDTSFAAPLCATGSLSTYVSADFNCDFAGATWSNFTFGVQGFSSTTPLTAAQITVTPSFSPQLDWSFTGAFTSGLGDQGTYVVGYSAIANSFQFTDTTVGFVLPGVISNGDGASLVRVIKQMNDDTGAPLYGAPFPSQQFDLAGGLTPPGFKAFGPESAVTILDNLNLVGGAVGTVSIAGFRNSFTETPVPAPTSALLLGIGLLGLALRSRRKARK